MHAKLSGQRYLFVCLFVICCLLAYANELIQINPQIISTDTSSQSNSPLIYLFGTTIDPANEEISLQHIRNPELLTSPRKQFNGNEYVLIQFKSPMKDKWREQLVAEGVKIYEYIPDYSYLAKVPVEKKDKLKATYSCINWIGEFRPIFKFSTAALFDYNQTQPPALQTETEINGVIISPLDTEVLDSPKEYIIVAYPDVNIEALQNE